MYCWGGGGSSFPQSLASCYQSLSRVDYGEVEGWPADRNHGASVSGVCVEREEREGEREGEGGQCIKMNDMVMLNFGSPIF